MPILLRKQLPSIPGVVRSTSPADRLARAAGADFGKKEQHMLDTPGQSINSGAELMSQAATSLTGGSCAIKSEALLNESDALVSARRAAAARLNERLEANESFSFLRLGDRELRTLVRAQRAESFVENVQVPWGCESARGTLGIGADQVQALQRAYEEADYLDLYQNQVSNVSMLSEWEFHRPRGYTTTSPEEAGVLPTWMLFYFREYLRHHSCLFFGGEAILQRELLADPRYKEIAAAFWPPNASTEFIAPVDLGRNPARDWRAIAEQLSVAAASGRFDTIFLSLGGAAKILAVELARAHHVRVIDFGAMLRALCYAGCNGNAASRAAHNVFLIRVPFDIHMGAVERAFADEPPGWIIAKAHGQLCLELQRKVLATSIPCDVHSPCSFVTDKQSLQAFEESLKLYRRRYAKLIQFDSDARRLDRQFQHWRRKKGLGLDGKLFRAGVACKGALRKLRSFVRS